MKQVKTLGKTTKNQDKIITVIFAPLLDEAKGHNDDSVLDNAQKLDSWHDDISLIEGMQEPVNGALENTIQMSQ